MSNINEQNVNGVKNVAEEPATPQEKDKIMLFLYEHQKLDVINLVSLCKVAKRYKIICQELVEIGYAQYGHWEESEKSPITICITLAGKCFCEAHSFSDPQKSLVLIIPAQEKDDVLRILFHHKSEGGTNTVNLNLPNQRHSGSVICKSLIRDGLVMEIGPAIFHLTSIGEQFCRTTSFSIPSHPIVFA